MTHNRRTPERPPSDDDALAAMLRAAAPDRFADGIANRVMRRVAGERFGAVASHDTPEFPEFTVVLQRQFVRIVPILAAASLFLAAYNWWGARTTSDSLLDATLRLPQVSIATAYTPELLFGEDGGGD
jgi:hypothetical protein